MSDEYVVPDAELKPWERRLRRFVERRPRLAAWVDRLTECELQPWWLWAAVTFVMWVVGPLMLAAVALGLWFVFGDPWNWVAASFAATAAVLAVATVVIGREDYQRGR